MEIQNPFPPPNQTAGTTEENAGLIKGSTLTARLLDITSLGQARLKIGSRVIQAILSQYVEPGKTVKLTVLETHPRLILEPFPEEKQTQPPPKPDIQPSAALKSSATGPLKKNATFTARILEVKPEGKLRLQLIPDQQEIRSAREKGYSPKPNTPVLEGRLEKNASNTGLSPGRVVKFTTIEPAPKLTVRPEPMTANRAASKTSGAVGGKSMSPAAPPTTELAESASQLRELLFSGNEPLTEMKPGLERLAELISGLSPKPDGNDSEFPARLMRGMGLFKGESPIQQEIARLFSHAAGDKPGIQADTPALRTLLESTAGFHDVLDRMQMTAGETMARDNSMLLAFPVFWPGSSGRGELRFQKPAPEEKESANRPWRVSILLDLSRIGRIKADVEVARTEVSGTVWAQSDSVRNVVAGSLERLSEGLTAKGFKIGELTVRLFPTDQPVPDTLAESPEPPEDGLVNLKV